MCNALLIFYLLYHVCIVLLGSFSFVNDSLLFFFVSDCCLKCFFFFFFGANSCLSARFISSFVFHSDEIR